MLLRPTRPDLEPSLDISDPAELPLTLGEPNLSIRPLISDLTQKSIEILLTMRGRIQRKPQLPATHRQSKHGAVSSPEQLPLNKTTEEQQPLSSTEQPGTRSIGEQPPNRGPELHPNFRPSFPRLRILPKINSRIFGDQFRHFQPCMET